MLQDAQCEGVLLLHPANYRWLTGGPTPRGLYGPEEMPVLFANAHNRWVFACNTDSQRLFDEELDELGFQLKEFHWSHSRDKLLHDLTQNRKIACDIDFRNTTHVGAFFEQERRSLSTHEKNLYFELGRLIAHALEATARNIMPGDTEEEIAGHLCHRLLKHGVEPISSEVAGDGRLQFYRRLEPRNRPVLNTCFLQATASKFGLFVTASRTVCFGEMDERFHMAFEIATRMTTLYCAALKAGEPFSKGIRIGRDFPSNKVAEDEWRLAPCGYRTGRQAVESLLTLTSSERLQENVPIIWQAKIGSVGVNDTFLFTEEGWKTVTEVETWPVRSIIIDGTTWKRPEILLRK